METHHTQRLLSQGSYSPFNYMSISDWWDRFVFEEDPSFTATVQDPSTALALSDQPFTAQKTSSIFSSVTKFFIGNGTTPPAQVQETFSELKSAVNTLSETKKTLVQHSPVTESLREKASLLQRELLKTMAMTPAEGSLFQSAQWVQRAEDQCYALEVLEAEIQVAMQKEKATSRD